MWTVTTLLIATGMTWNIGEYEDRRSCTAAIPMEAAKLAEDFGAEIIRERFLNRHGGVYIYTIDFYGQTVSVRAKCAEGEPTYFPETEESKEESENEETVDDNSDGAVQ